MLDAAEPKKGPTAPMDDLGPLPAKRKPGVVVPIPLTRYDATVANNAYAAYIAVLKRQMADPSLTQNLEWVLLREYAYRRFERAYEAPL